MSWMQTVKIHKFQKTEHCITRNNCFNGSSVKHQKIAVKRSLLVIWLYMRKFLKYASRDPPNLQLVA